MKSNEEIIEVYLKVNAACIICKRHGVTIDSNVAAMLAFKDALAWVLGVEEKPTEDLVSNIENFWKLFPKETQEHFRKLGHIRK